MVHQEMGFRWTIYGARLSLLALLILVWRIQGCSSVNLEGVALLKFRERVVSDPYAVLSNWSPLDYDPCLWTGIHCLDGEVQSLDLHGCHLEGTLASELANLTQLRSIVLSKNHFSGVIPVEFGQLLMLEVLDLGDNNLSGAVPEELAELHSLKRLLLHNNNFKGGIPPGILKLNLITELQFDENDTSTGAASFGCVNRKIVDCMWRSSFKPLENSNTLLTPIKARLTHYFSLFPLFNLGRTSLENPGDDECCSNVPSSEEPRIMQTALKFAIPTRRKLAEQSSNLAAVSPNGVAPIDPVVTVPMSRSSGSFPAVPNRKKESSPPPDISPIVPSQDNPNGKPPPDSANGKSGDTWKYVVGIVGGCLLVIVAAVIFFICRSRTARTIPWKTGLSGQLQKAFVTGVPKLNRAELETACEDFSNIIETFDAVTMYKGTLSSGVEIAVASTTIPSKDWSKQLEIEFRKKIESLSRVNHKNFVNLIGYCEEDEPFARMMVFEYAPSGSLSEHLHVEEVEHLDWSTRIRIIMGTAYCLQYMHDLDPPQALSHLKSESIYLTDDNAAKVADSAFWNELLKMSTNPGASESQHPEPTAVTSAKSDVFSFGLLLLEIISGKPLHSEEQESLLNWAAQYLNDQRNVSCLIDPSLKSFKTNQLSIICEVIQNCIQVDPSKRPTMKEVTSTLREVLDISPEQATPRLSPLWWAELEILSAEAA